MNLDLVEEIRDFLGGSQSIEEGRVVKEAANYGSAFVNLANQKIQ